ncbi:MAG: hypothetical protein JXA50_02985 [Deltaproteobacteria bacterium]|nr:hypothetical protein [Deltaproteobacteria bacterium]
MTDEPKINTVCKGCGKLLSPDEQGSEYCSSCMIERAEEYVPEAPEKSPIKREKKSKAWVIVQVAIIVIGLAVMALQTPRLIAALHEGQPLREGTYATDTETDQCIKNLWHISKLLQEGQLHTNGIVCPLSNKPYEIRDTGEEIVVSCPNPELHGLKQIQVSKRHPVPKVSK